MIAAMSNAERVVAPSGAATRENDEAIASVEEQFTVLFNKVSAGMRDRAAGVHPDLQPVGFKLLSTLARTGPVHAGALAGMLSTDKSVVSRQVRILEDLGLVERRSDPEDRRASYLVATTEAIEKVNEVRASDQRVFYSNLRKWDRGDVEQLASLLARVNGTGR
ncbi:winged helix-turn-helix transcriptional regulator [Leifsonia sp. PS1209]|nr:winged helix-turn-helix transcriptional regulator [Leifsonia sp. PS1209]